MAYPGGAVSKVKAVNATLMIIGTSIGAGMLGLPVETSRGGFGPTALLLLASWAVMSVSALLFVDVIDARKNEGNYLSLSESLFGKVCRSLTFFVYIILFVSLTLAYAKGGGVFIAESLGGISPAVGCLLFLALFVPLIVSGSTWIGSASSLLTFGLVLSFFGLCFLGLKKVHGSFLSHSSWKHAVSSLPIFVTAFGFHGVLPSLHRYVGNKGDLKKAIVVGTFTTFLIYTLWQLVVMGVVPLEGEHSLVGALMADRTAVSPLMHYLNTPILSFCARMFYFTALTTSFLGVGLGLVDFFLDSFGMKNRLSRRLLWGLVIYIPTLALAQTNLRIFYLSLKYGGGFASLYLLLLLPILLFAKQRSLRSMSETGIS